jgi:hypothetical protein
MKTNLITSLSLLVLVGALNAQSIFNGYAYVSDTTAGTDVTWYNLSGSAQSSSFQGADLGDFTTNLWLGGQTGFWSDGAGTQSVILNYNITGDATATGTVAYSFQHFEGPAGTNNDQYGTDINGSNTSDGSSDLIAAHSLAAGDYNIAVWVVATANDSDTAFDSNSSNNYNATFTVVPEASTCALFAGLGVLAFVLIRRLKQ